MWQRCARPPRVERRRHSVEIVRAHQTSFQTTFDILLSSSSNDNSVANSCCKHVHGVKGSEQDRRENSSRWVGRLSVWQKCQLAKQNSSTLHASGPGDTLSVLFLGIRQNLERLDSLRDLSRRNESDASQEINRWEFSTLFGPMFIAPLLLLRRSVANYAMLVKFLW